MVTQGIRDTGNIIFGQLQIMREKLLNHLFLLFSYYLYDDIFMVTYP